MGGDGLLIRTATDTRLLTASRVEVVDESGAGDAFAAGLIVGIVEGWPLEPSLRFASEVGALACTALGCSAGIPNLEQVLRQMATH
jgi:5-dehydro-2-deoxygluconokinase